MFTGIITSISSIQNIERKKGAIVLSVRRPKKYQKISKGESIAVNGVCLTAMKVGSSVLQFFCQPETLDCTTLGGLQKGSVVNLERALRVSERLGGHIVQGHVDFTTTIMKVETFAESYRYWLKSQAGCLAMVKKGSVALDGVSLTISRLTQRQFAVDIIPHTWKHTNIAGWQKGTSVNVETDILGKYAASYLQVYAR